MEFFEKRKGESSRRIVHESIIQHERFNDGKREQSVFIFLFFLFVSNNLVSKLQLCCSMR